jgi:hypothetical protein
MNRADVVEMIKQTVDRVFEKRQQLVELNRLQRQVAEMAKSAREQGLAVGDGRTSLAKAEKVRSAQAKLDAFDAYHAANPSDRIWGNPRVKMDRQVLKRELIEARTGESPIWSHLI